MYNSHENYMRLVEELMLMAGKEGREGNIVVMFLSSTF